MPVSENEVKVSLRIQPGAAKNEVVGFVAEILRVKVAAPPVKGKANRELILFLSKILEIKRDHISVARGLTSRNKVISVFGLSREEVMRRMLSASSSGATTI